MLNLISPSQTQPLRQYLVQSNLIIHMRGHKLKLSQIRNVHKNMKQKVEKEADTLMQLMELPDFDTSEFFQTLLKSQHYQPVLDRIPVEKKVYFFAKNYEAFLETQDELLKLELPKLEEVPQAKHSTFDQEKPQQQPENFEQSSVLQIIDSFSSFVLEKNLEETLRVLQIIQQMKKHSKYKPYFDCYSTNKIFLETYKTFVDNCTSYETLLQINQYNRAIKVYLQEKQTQILGEIKINLNFNDSAESMGKQTLRLVEYVQKQTKLFKLKFKRQLEKHQYINTELSSWIKRVTQQFYALVQSHVYEKEQLSEIQDSFNVILSKSTEYQLKGISLERQLKERISVDLPLHISKVIEIIIDSVNQILKEKNELYEFTYFSSIKQFSKQLAHLKQITPQDFGIKCATCKGIILVNSFVLILSTLCDEKWTFIQQGVLSILINKIALNILNSTLHYWDYYHIFIFFERLGAGRVRHKLLFTGHPPPGLNQKLEKIRSLAKSSWQLFENKVANEFFRDILSTIPEQLYSFGRYGYSQQKQDSRPSTFSISLIFKFEDFFKQLEFRLMQTELQIIVRIFYEYVLYTIEYVLYWNYHNKGTNNKVFFLTIKEDRLLKKVKEFNFLDIQVIKKRQILELSKLSKYGFLKLAFEIYFMTQIYKVVSKSSKIDCEQFLSRLAKILAKDQDKPVIDTSIKQFQDALNKIKRVYRERPEMLKQYLLDKKKS